MIGILIVTHGGLARELLARRRAHRRPLGGFAALSLDWNDALEEARRQGRGRARASSDSGDGVLILTDMFGDTPSQRRARASSSRAGSRW